MVRRTTTVKQTGTVKQKAAAKGAEMRTYILVTPYQQVQPSTGIRFYMNNRTSGVNDAWMQAQVKAGLFEDCGPVMEG